MAKPDAFLIPKVNRIKNVGSQFRMAKMIDPSRFCANGDEINRGFLHPVRGFVVQVFPVGSLHFEMLTDRNTYAKECLT